MLDPLDVVGVELIEVVLKGSGSDNRYQARIPVCTSDERQERVASAIGSDALVEELDGPPVRLASEVVVDCVQVVIVSVKGAPRVRDRLERHDG